MKSYTIIIFFQVTGLVYSQKQCRDKFGLHDPDFFNVFSCSWCYFFLFPQKPLKPNPANYFLISAYRSETFPRATIFTPDITNRTSIANVCRTLTNDECIRWQDCCSAAHNCCDRQLETTSDKTNSCLSTWDGYGCWDTTLADTERYLSCPPYLQYSMPTRQAVKTCHPNGTWLSKSGSDWTDYTPCLEYEELKISIYISLACNAACIILLAPALFIFFRYRTLLKQHRIRLHINFFLSFLLSSTTIIIWDIVVTYERLTNGHVSQTILYKNGVGCKLLSFFKIYLGGTRYVWMSCEGFYLHQLISNAFSPPRSLIPLYAVGWGTSLISALLYSILRSIMADESCWAKSFGNQEWIIYTPNLICLSINVFFLCDILRILMTQMQTHPNEPSNFRRALKATFVLIPLFGVQLLVTIYRLPITTEGALEYERFSIFISNSQGFFVALIFCFLNGEVLSLLKRTWRKRVKERSLRLYRRNTTLTSNNTVSMRCDSEMFSERPRENGFSRISVRRTNCGEPPQRTDKVCDSLPDKTDEKRGGYFKVPASGEGEADETLL